MQETAVMTKEEITKSQFYAGDNWGRKLKQELAAVQEPLLGKRIVKVEDYPWFRRSTIYGREIPKAHHHRGGRHQTIFQPSSRTRVWHQDSLTFIPPQGLRLKKVS